jgi:hypothetical protein
MKTSQVYAVAAAFGTALAKEVAPNAELAAELYDSGVRHEQNMELKEVLITISCDMNE